jgi:hypothetical protein
LAKPNYQYEKRQKDLAKKKKKEEKLARKAQKSDTVLAPDATGAPVADASAVEVPQEP